MPETASLLMMHVRAQGNASVQARTRQWQGQTAFVPLPSASHPVHQGFGSCAAAQASANDRGSEPGMLHDASLLRRSIGNHRIPQTGAERLGDTPSSQLGPAAAPNWHPGSSQAYRYGSSAWWTSLPKPWAIRSMHHGHYVAMLLVYHTTAAVSGPGPIDVLQVKQGPSGNGNFVHDSMTAVPDV